MRSMGQNPTEDELLALVMEVNLDQPLLKTDPDPVFDRTKILGSGSAINYILPESPLSKYLGLH